jgi:hypothetical protein
MSARHALHGTAVRLLLGCMACSDQPEQTRRRAPAQPRRAGSPCIALSNTPDVVNSFVSSDRGAPNVRLDANGPLSNEAQWWIPAQERRR